MRGRIDSQSKSVRKCHKVGSTEGVEADEVLRMTLKRVSRGGDDLYDGGDEKGFSFLVASEWFQGGGEHGRRTTSARANRKRSNVFILMLGRRWGKCSGKVPEGGKEGKYRGAGSHFHASVFPSEESQEVLPQRGREENNQGGK